MHGGGRLFHLASNPLSSRGIRGRRMRRRRRRRR
jgi:hypothetical protein